MACYYTTAATDSTSDVWPMWLEGTGATTSASEVWGQWVECDATTTSSGHRVWLRWNTGTASTTATVARIEYSPKPLTPEERERLEQQDRIRREERAKQQAAFEAAEKERQAQSEAAERKAAETLQENLSPVQRKTLRHRHYFYVRGSKGGRYRIKKGWSGNVEGLNERGRATDRFCIHPREYVPEHDNMLSQKLLLETDEDAFLQTANRTRLRQPVGAN